MDQTQEERKQKLLQKRDKIKHFIEVDFPCLLDRAEDPDSIGNLYEEYDSALYELYLTEADLRHPNIVDA